MYQMEATSGVHYAFALGALSQILCPIIVGGGVLAGVRHRYYFRPPYFWRVWLETSVGTYGPANRCCISYRDRTSGRPLSALSSPILLFASLLVIDLVCH